MIEQGKLKRKMLFTFTFQTQCLFTHTHLLFTHSANPLDTRRCQWRDIRGRHVETNSS